MRRTYPYPGQVGFSDATKSLVYIKEMVWAKRRWLETANQNYCPYSDYDATFWTSTAEDKGTISIGSDYLAAWPQVAMNGSTSYVGVQTWSGSGSLTSQEAAFTGASTLCFSCSIGNYHLETDVGFVVTLTAQDQDGNTLTTRTWPSHKAGFRPWITCSVPATVTGIVMVVDVVASGQWYVENLQLEKDTATPGPLCKTSGAAAVVSADRVVTGMARIEREEVERVVEDWETRGVPKGDPSFSQVTKVADNV